MIDTPIALEVGTQRPRRTSGLGLHRIHRRGNESFLALSQRREVRLVAFGL
jgi:hypothetical protein